jgi:hypothetical protein
VAEWVERTGVSPEHAVWLRALEAVENPHPDVARLVAAARSGRLELGDDAKDRWLAELARRVFGERRPRIG